jgi:hypothetical protein
VNGGDFHSLYAAATHVFVVKDGVLGWLQPDYEFIPIHGGMGSNPVSFVQVGPDVYFSSASMSGVIRDDLTVDPWGSNDPGGTTWLSPVVNPTSTLFPVKGKVLKKPPLATALTYFSGRIYLAQERTLWATELYLYNYVDQTKNFKFFESNITAIGAVTDGVYVGTETGLYFMSGSYHEMKRVTLSSYGVLPGSMVTVPAELVNPKVELEDVAESRNALLFMTASGVVAGFDGGLTFNLTQTDVIFPNAQRAAAVFRRDAGVNSYVSVLDSGGSPSANTRIGDHIDGSIVRFANRPTVSIGIGLGDSVEAEIV